MDNERMLERLHNRWLDPPEPPEEVCEECGSDEDVIRMIYGTYICGACVEMRKELDRDLEDEEDEG